MMLIMFRESIGNASNVSQLHSKGLCVLIVWTLFVELAILIYNVKLAFRAWFGDLIWWCYVFVTGDLTLRK